MFGSEKILPFPKISSLFPSVPITKKFQNNPLCLHCSSLFLSPSSSCAAFPRIHYLIHSPLFMGRNGFGPNLNTLNQVWPSKIQKKSKNISQILCFIQKVSIWHYPIALHNYIRRRSHDDVAFAKFDRNLNFIHDDILPDVVARSGSHENYISCRMDFVCNNKKYFI